MPPTASADTDAEALLQRVRDLQPRDLLRLATLWAGVHEGTLDAGRQRRRTAARVALRFVTRRMEPELANRESIRAAAAVRAVVDPASSAWARSIRGPAADASFAIADALDAIAYRDELTQVAYDELLLPWRQLLAEIGA